MKHECSEQKEKLRQKSGIAETSSEGARQEAVDTCSATSPARLDEPLLLDDETTSNERAGTQS